MADALLSIVLERLASFVTTNVDLVLGVEAEIQSLRDTLQSVRGVLEDAERRQVEETSVQVWLEKLKEMAYQMDDVVDEWSTILQLQIEGTENASMAEKVCSCIPISTCIPISACIPISSWIPSFFFKQVASRRDIADKIKKIKQKLDEIDGDRIRFHFTPNRNEEQSQPLKTTSATTSTSITTSATTSAIAISKVYGRDMDKNTILDHLLGKKCQEKSGLYIISIVGTGGMGKTTLAQLAYNHPEVMAHFDERIWVCVSDPFDPVKNFTAIVENLQKRSCDLHDLEALQQKARTCIAKKKFLLVLDDVWTEDHRLWDQLENTLNDGAVGSRILVTTRKENVAMVMGTTFMHSIRELSQEQSRALFHQIAFSGKSREKVEELKEIGEKIADKCKGLPLAIKTLGFLMRLKNNKEKWENILNSEVWQLNEFEREICPPLLLSYYDLLPAIKRCFSFCAVFPKNTVIEIDRLIKLWMAQGYLNMDRNQEMETVGREYFEYLAARSFFQDFEKDDDDNIIRCKMHDIMHDFAQFLSKSECFIMNVENAEGRTRTSFQNIRHATVIGQQRHPNFVSAYGMKNLHTLLLEFTFSRSSDEAPTDLFEHFTCLRALNLASIKALPEALGKLIHLRYLNLSLCVELRELPETICDLYNLQTLNIRYCSYLAKLPQAMGKLVNLRHLQNRSTSNLERLPKGIARLNSLQTLEKFTVRNDGDNECKIGDLGNLNNLSGELEIRELRKVEDAREAQKAELKNKEYLQHLRLEFGEMEGAKGVAEALEPHPNLKSLSICGYGDTEWHGWMMRPSLTQLKNLQFLSCGGCRCMPPLGELPALEKLEIWDMKSVKHIGGEFLGSSPAIAFLKLKKLTFRHMGEWEKWEVKEEQRSMQCLSYLEIHNCPKLEGLPDHVLQSTSLQELVIMGSDILHQRYRLDIGGDREKVSHIRKVKY